MNAIVFETASVQFGRRTALDGISATLAAGSVTGIVGPNGAGKTTLIRAALGLQELSGGAVRILDKSLAAWSRTELARAAAYLPQGGQARWPMKASDVVLLGRLPFRNAFGEPSARDLAAVADALARCDATAFAARRMDELSALTKELDVAGVYAFSWGVLDQESTVHARFFVPQPGMQEDPASGLPAGALGAYLVENEFIQREKYGSIVVEQGHWMGRPSKMYVRVDRRGSTIQKVEVGGSAVISFRGRLVVP